MTKRRRGYTSKASKTKQPRLAACVQDDGVKYEVYLVLSNSIKNSYYHMKLIELNENKFTLEVEYGTVGTQRPRSSNTEFSDRKKAKKEFQKRFAQKTENTWMSYCNGGFIGREGSYIPLKGNQYDVDSEEEEQVAVTRRVTRAKMEERKLREQQRGILSDIVIVPDEVIRVIIRYVDLNTVAALSRLNSKYHRIVQEIEEKYWLDVYNSSYNKAKVMKANEVYYDKISDTVPLTIDKLRRMQGLQVKAKEIALHQHPDTVYPNVTSIKEFLKRIVLRENDKKISKSKEIRLCLRELEAHFEERDTRDITVFDILDSYLNDPRIGRFSKLVVGVWTRQFYKSDTDEVMKEVIENYQLLKHIKSMFFGDLCTEDNRISWTILSDFTPLLAKFPLYHFKAKGGDMGIHPFKSDTLMTIKLVTGALGASIVAGIISSHLPNLTHLQLWLGGEDYGASTLEEFSEALKPLLSETESGKFPCLDYLGLRNYERIDDLCDMIGKSALCKRIRVLDLSMGCFGDEGAQALLKAWASGVENELCLQLLVLRDSYVFNEEYHNRLLSLPFCVDLRNRRRLDDGKYVTMGDW